MEEKNSETGQRTVQENSPDDQPVSSLVKNGKNGTNVACRYCSSRILNPGMSEYIKIEYNLPLMEKDSTKGDANSQEETVADYWCVDNIYTFENIGFSNTVGDVKYLACADCEKGPVGWHNLQSKKSYVAIPRVKHFED